MKVKTYNKITDIPKRKYQGYIWFSDKTKPLVLLEKEDFDFSSIKTQNPFIVEALLYSEEGNQSIMIKHTDKYIIKEYNLSELTRGTEVVEKEYLPHRLEGVNKLKFTQIWVEAEDPFCEKMETLQLKATVFTGFITKTTNNG